MIAPGDAPDLDEELAAKLFREMLHIDGNWRGRRTYDRLPDPGEGDAPTGTEIASALVALPGPPD